jgi:hypothetical protein
MKKFAFIAVMLTLMVAGGGEAIAAAKKGAATSGSSGGFDVQNLYGGFGLSLNALSGFDDAMGWQIFGGYDLPWKLGPAKTAVEVGYMTSGEFEQSVTVPFVGTIKATSEAKGIWATGVVAYPVNTQFDILGRLGYDFGDDDGLMLGLGAGYWINKQVSVRAEYVIRDNIDSLQVNLLYHF